MMKSLLVFLATVLSMPVPAFAADAIKIDIYLAGALKQSVSLSGPNSSVKFTPLGMPNTVIELRLIAPEPIILEMKETTTDGEPVEVVGRIKLHTPGGSYAVSEMKGTKFHNAYVFVRPN